MGNPGASEDLGQFSLALAGSSHETGTETPVMGIDIELFAGL